VKFPEPVKFARPSRSTLLPLAGSIVDDGSFETDEEQKLRNESRKILDIPSLLVSGTCVRCRSSPGTRCRSTPSSRADLGGPGDVNCWYGAGRRPVRHSTPLQAAGTDPSYVGRIRTDPACPTAVDWPCSSATKTLPQGRRPERRPNSRATPLKRPVPDRATSGVVGDAEGCTIGRGCG